MNRMIKNIFVFLIFILFSVNILHSEESDDNYWNDESILIEYNPIFHFSQSIGGQIEMSFMKGFSVETEFLYLHTDLFTPLSGERILDQKVMGWKIFIEPVVYFLPMLRLFKILIGAKDSMLVSFMQQSLTGPYFGFGLVMGRFEGYTQSGYGANFGAGIGGKIGMRIVVLKHMSLNFYMSVSGFFNPDIYIVDSDQPSVNRLLSEQNYDYLSKVNFHVGVNIGLYLPIGLFLKYYKGSKPWAE